MEDRYLIYDKLEEEFQKLKKFISVHVTSVSHSELLMARSMVINKKINNLFKFILYFKSSYSYITFKTRKGSESSFSYTIEPIINPKIAKVPSPPFILSFSEMTFCIKRGPCFSNEKGSLIPCKILFELFFFNEYNSE